MNLVGNSANLPILTHKVILKYEGGSSSENDEHKDFKVIPEKQKVLVFREIPLSTLLPYVSNFKNIQL